MVFVESNADNYEKVIQKKENEIKSLKADPSVFLPFVRNVFIAEKKYINHVEVTIGKRKYIVTFQHGVSYHDSWDEGGYANGKLEVEVFYNYTKEKRTPLPKRMFKKQEFKVDVQHYTNHILWVSGTFGHSEKKDFKPSEIKLCKTVCVPQNSEEMNHLYAINSVIVDKINKRYEEDLLEKDKQIAMKRLCPVPDLVKFKEVR